MKNELTDANIRRIPSLGASGYRSGSSDSNFSVRIFPPGHTHRTSVKVPPRSIANKNLLEDIETFTIGFDVTSKLLDENCKVISEPVFRRAYLLSAYHHCTENSQKFVCITLCMSGGVTIAACDDIFYSLFVLLKLSKM